MAGSDGLAAVVISGLTLCITVGSLVLGMVWRAGRRQGRIEDLTAAVADLARNMGAVAAALEERIRWLEREAYRARYAARGRR